MNIHQTIQSVSLTLSDKDVGTCEKHMGQHKKQKDCKLWRTIAPARLPAPKMR